MTNKKCGIDFRIGCVEPVPFEPEDAGAVVLDVLPAGDGVDLEAAGGSPAALEIAAHGPEPPAELVIGEAVIVTGIYPEYDGPTTVVSRIGAETVLETAMTTVMSDITVERIPVWEVSNPAGGVTVTIGRN